MKSIIKMWGRSRVLWWLVFNKELREKLVDLMRMEIALWIMREGRCLAEWIDPSGAILSVRREVQSG